MSWNECVCHNEGNFASNIKSIDVWEFTCKKLTCIYTALISYKKNKK